MESGNKKQFIGPLGIVGASLIETKTAGGNDVVEVLYSRGTKDLMPKSSFDQLVTDKQTDWNDLRDRKFKAIISELVDVMVEFDIKSEDLEALFIKLKDHFTDIFNRATNFLWTGDDTQFIPGTNPSMERSILEAELIYRDINARIKRDIDTAKDEPGEEKNSG